MVTRTLKIKNMCCDRCIMVVRQTLAEAGYAVRKVELGSAVIIENKNGNEADLQKALKKSGFGIIITKEEDACEKIKIAVHKIFFDSKTEDYSGFDMKAYLQAETGMPYNKLRDIFSKGYKTTLEKYFIQHRIEKVKAMIEDTDLSFSQIAFSLGYNSLSHLSRQFKDFEGISMHDYKHSPKKNRKAIDKL